MIATDCASQSTFGIRDGPGKVGDASVRLRDWSEVRQWCQTTPYAFSLTEKEKNLMRKSKRAVMLTSWVLLAVMGLGFVAQHATAQDAAPEADAAETEAAPADAAPAADGDPEGAYSTDEYIASPGYATFTVNNLWICISAALVFIMHLGFTTLESGLTQKKNAVNIIFKNVWIVCMGILLYAAWGFNAMYPGTMGEDWDGYFAAWAVGLASR